MIQEKINIAELLKDCPQGMELDCAIWDSDVKVFLKEVLDDDAFIYPIVVTVKHNNIEYPKSFTKYGAFNDLPYYKCVIFPKGKTTWEGFVPPCNFKDGDIVYIKTKGHNHNEYIIIFKEIKNDHIHKYVCFTYQHLSIDKCALCHLVDAEIMRLATEEEKQKLFDAIKANGYKWNPETKTLEKLPKFKVGDKIKHKCEKFRDERIIVSYGKSGYWTSINDWIDYENQDDWELVPNKFDINTLIPFESKVLIRNYENKNWIPSFWGCKLTTGYLTTYGWYMYCIPYEGNEHLLGKKDDCSEYYKTWK